MNRKNFSFRQKVTEAELDGAINAAETAEQQFAIDNDLAQKVDGSGIPIVTPLTEDFRSLKGGITSGLTVTISGLIATIAPGTAYDGQGRRINVSSSLTVDLSNTGDVPLGVGGVPTGGFATTVPSGQTRWITLAVFFNRALSDPRTDGNGQTVFFNEDESFQFRVKAGNPTSGTAAKPSLDANLVVLGDFLRNDASAITTQEFNRRGDWIRMSAIGPSIDPPTAMTEDGTSTDNKFIQGSARDAIVKLRNMITLATGNYVGHINQSTPVDRHAAKNIDFAATAATWADGTNPAVPAHTGGGTINDGVQRAINDVVAILAANTGSAKIGMSSISHGTVSVSAGTLDHSLQQLGTALDAHVSNTSGAHAATAISATTGGVRSSTTVQGQLQNLDDNKASTAFSTQFGDGSDGDLVLNTVGDTNLTSVKNFRNLSVSGGHRLHTLHPIYVRDTFTIDGSTGSFIDEYPFGGNSKSGASAASGGAGGVGTNSNVFSGSLLGGGSGGRGGIGAGTGENGVNGVATTNSLGGTGGSGSSVGSFTGGAAGGGTFLDATMSSSIFASASAHPGYVVVRGGASEAARVLTLVGIMGGTGGGGGCAQIGHIGGGGGAGAGVLIIFANNVVINLNNVLRAIGGDGGDGSSLESGGGGGGGGCVILGYRKLTLTSGATNPFLTIGGGGGVSVSGHPAGVGTTGTVFSIDMS